MSLYSEYPRDRSPNRVSSESQFNAILLSGDPPHGSINPRPTGTPNFPPPTGGGGGGVSEHPLHLSRLLLVVEKNGKSVRKLVKNDYETISVKFSLRSKLWPLGTKKAQNFEFLRLSNNVSEKPPLSRELL